MLVLGTGTTVVGVHTRGFRAFTADSARRIDVARAPRRVPSLPVVDHTGQVGPLLVSDGRICVLDFVYTRCPTLCVALGDQFDQLQAVIHQHQLGGRVSLRSVSFDLAHDDVPELASYAARHRADPRLWRIVRPLSRGDLAQLLDLLEVVVLPDGLGGFIHNAALHVVDEQARLVDIVDSIEAVLAHVERPPA